VNVFAKKKEEEKKGDSKEEEKKQGQPVKNVEKNKLSDVKKSKLDNRTAESIILDWNDRLESLTQGFTK